MTTINLGDFRSSGVPVYAGRDRGVAVRNAVDLDELDVGGDSVQVVVPADIYSINSSFLLGMFGPSVRALGSEAFREQYEFGGPGYDDLVARAVEDAIREALLHESPLA